VSGVQHAVFDTNIWISGLLWRGKPHQCLLLAQSGAVELAYCDEMLDELAEKLRGKFGFSARDAAAVLAMAEESDNGSRFAETCEGSPTIRRMTSFWNARGWPELPGSSAATVICSTWGNSRQSES
jgi:hypothetical protein